MLDATKDGPAPMVSMKKSTPEQDRVQSKLDLTTALSYLSQDNYEKVACSLLWLGLMWDLGKWAGRLISTSNVTVYRMVCTMASLLCGTFKVHMLHNQIFKHLLQGTGDVLATKHDQNGQTGLRRRQRTHPPCITIEAPSLHLIFEEKSLQEEAG
ncbi:hypothetical protein IW261DRAFT_1675966 [Armillaria novae-zelandiae]|uniref:Uncharacterized protein n=1 Tax=Armillaria novae-zelandiae TaxID=153914 RepID=A0AA39U9L7_9AGAR|nr:hypothetical protein IW261DRAFT_1675966 [Armillaria novae-zelandiae]